MSEIRNLHPDPRCLRKRTTWNGSATSNGEKWRYERSANAANGSVFAWNGLTDQFMAGKVLYARVTGTKFVIDRLAVEAATTIAKADTWIAARVADDNTSSHAIWVNDGPVVLDEVGVYTPDDWESLYALYQKGDITYPWVAGPRNATAAGKKGPWEL